MPTGYAATWALFTDWCDVTGNTPLPADPVVVAAFLADCPAAAATQRRRVIAIDYHHAATGYAPPGNAGAVSAVVGRPRSVPARPSPEVLSAVRAALRQLPSHGWTQGMFGRLDRCLLVLSQLARVPYQHLALLTAGNVTVTGGTATVIAGGRGWAVEPVDDPMVCGPCAVVRWLRILDINATKIATSAVARALDKALAVGSDSPHLCRSTRPVADATLPAPLLPPINQWGALPFPHPRLTPHSQSRRTRDLLAGDFVAHRALPVPTDDATPEPAPDIVEEVGSVYDRAAADRAWTKRRGDLQHLAGVADVLTDVDRRIADLQQRVAMLLDEQAN